MAIPTWTIGDRLRKARNTAGIGVADMAGRLGVNAKSITRWERAQDGAPRRTVLAYAHETNVPVEWLDGADADDPEPDRELVTEGYPIAA